LLALLTPCHARTPLVARGVRVELSESSFPAFRVELSELS